MRWELGETLDELTDRANPKRMVQRRTARVRSGFRSVRESVMGSGQFVTRNVAGGAQQLGDQASSAASTVADQARHAPEVIQRQTHGNPIAAGLIAFGAGLLVATLIRSSEPEQQAASALQDKLEPVKDKAIEAGQDIKDQVQDAAREGLEHVKETASGAAQQVKSDAQAAGGELKDQAQQSAQQVRSTDS